MVNILQIKSGLTFNGVGCCVTYKLLSLGRRWKSFSGRAKKSKYLNWRKQKSKYLNRSFISKLCTLRDYMELHVR